MIPTVRLAWWLVVPTVLGAVWVLWPEVGPAIVAVDGVLLLLAGIDALGSGAPVRASRRFEALQSVGRAFPVTIRVENPSRRRLTLTVDDAMPGTSSALPARLVLGAGEAADVERQHTVHERGQHRAGPITVRWTSRWGLWARQRRFEGEPDQAVRVYPDFTFLRQDAMRGRADDHARPVRVRRRAGGESEFLRLRPYVAGDPFRHVDWKATARRRGLVTREYGQEVAQNVILVLEAGRAMTMTHDGVVAFDQALASALALGHGALKHGDRVGLLVYDRDVRAWIPPSGGRSHATRLVQASYDVFPRLEEPDAALALRHLAARVRRRSLVVMFTAATDEVNAEAAEAVVRALGSRHLPLVVWLSDPRFAARAIGGSAPDDDAYLRGASAATARWRLDALARWRAHGALTVDAPPGTLSATLLSAYLDIKARRLL